MSNVRLLTPWVALDPDVLTSWEPFAKMASEAGFEVMVEWVDPWTDPEDGEEYEGYFHWFTRHEALCSDGRLHAHMLDLLPETPARGEEVWRLELEMADIGWRDYLERGKLAA